MSTLDPTTRQMIAGGVALALAAAALKGLSKTRELDELHKLQDFMEDLPPAMKQRFPSAPLYTMISDITNYANLTLTAEADTETATFFTKKGVTTKGGARQ